MLSSSARQELRRLSLSTDLRRDMAAVAAAKHNPFVKEGIVDVDAYIDFVTAFNEFINHQTKAFTPIIDKDMRL